MRKAGVIMLVIGLLITILTGFNLITNEKETDLANPEISAGNNQHTDWSPLTGVTVMMVGGAVFLIGGKER
ncbi:MAG: hypothetical protein R6V27_13255 [Balneolaceae bacterium]